MHYSESDDGKVIDGKIVVFLRPRRSRDDGGEGASPSANAGEEQSAAGEGSGAGHSGGADEGDATDSGTGGDEAESKKATEGEAEEGPVRNLRWSAASAADGDEVEMAADVDGDPGLLFTLEQRVGDEAWKPVGSVKAEVSGGTAKATVKVQHPGSLSDVHFRFRARIL
jgi:hypothetical protein